ncbi:MAG: endonuclease domain-containing protein [Clostridia bacterium]|nr:endonuclease domain-containing protein [Clostridia bacterium]MBR5768842.1 endonuclease domain-containing protein [Clostridia bacterium]
MKDYNRSNIPLAKVLRKNMTKQEKQLWYKFLRSYPIRFQRQKAIYDYIVDFYCAQVKLVVELDGGGHYSEEQAVKDAARTAELEKMGIKVIRVCNTDVDDNLRGVCEYIEYVVKQRLNETSLR